MDPLFPIITAKYDPPASKNETLPPGWKTIGKNLSFLEKKEKASAVPAPSNTTTAPSQSKPFPKSDTLGHSIEEQQKRYYGINNRVRASDIIAKDLMKKKLKKEKKKKKEKEERKKKQKQEKIKNKIKRQQLMKLPTDAELDEYFDKKIEEEKKLDPNIGFLYNHSLKQGVLPITIMRFGEEDNYKYGLKVGKVPKFRRLEYNLIIGLLADRNTQDILDELNTIQGLTKKKHVAPDDVSEFRYYTDLKLIQSSGEIFYTNDQCEMDIEELRTRDFISFTDDKLDVTNPTEDPEKEKDPLEFSFERGDMTKSEFSIIQRQKQLNKDLEKNPGELSLWLEFLGFQDKGSTAGKNKQLVIEKKISIVEKAMTHKELENDETLIFMHLKYLDAANKNDDFYKVLHGIWTKYLETNFHKAFFWGLFLDFKYSKFSKFSATIFRENISAHFKDVTTRIKEEPDMNKKRSLKKVLLVILNKVAFIEKEMGFHERGLGILQAVMEWNIFGRGSSTSFFQEKKLKEFQNFWEMRGSLRTGEVLDLNGWEEMKNFSEQDFAKKLEDPSFLGHLDSLPLISSCPDSRSIFEQDALKQNPLFHRSEVIDWFKSEKGSETWRPANIAFDTARINSSTDSVVFFEDIEPYLFFFNDETLNTNILNLFLSFLNFPTIDNKFFGSIESTDFISNIHIRIEQQIMGKFTHDEAIGKEKQGINWLDDLGTMDLLIKFKNLPFLCDNTNPIKKLSKFEYVRRVLYAFQKKNKADGVLTYLFILECAYYVRSEESFNLINKENSKEAGKRIKSLLKENEKNMLLWCIYAEIEFIKTHDISKSEKVFHNVIHFLTNNTEKVLVMYFYASFYLRHQKFLLRAGITLSLKLSIVFQYLEKILKNEPIKDIPTESDIPPLQLKLLSSYCRKQMDESKEISRRGTSLKKQSCFPLKKKSAYLFFHSLIELGAKNNDADINSTIEQMHQRKMYKLSKLFGSERKSKKSAYFEQHQFHLLNLLRIKKFTNIYQNHKEKVSLFDSVKCSISRYPYNQTFIKEFFHLNSQLTLRPNRLMKLKELLGMDTLSTSIWLLHLFIENLDTSVSQIDPIHRVHSLFKKIIQEDNLYDRGLATLMSLNKQQETKYSINLKFNNNINSRARLLDLFLLHLLGFLDLLPKDQFHELYRKKSLIAIHMSPYSKELYLNYMLSCSNDEKALLEAYKIMANREIRLYSDPQEIL